MWYLIGRDLKRGEENMKRGLVEIYTGRGKGKTTAALGLTVRAAGCGFTVRFFQFCKGSPTGEIGMLKNMPRVEFFRSGFASGKFVKEMTPQEKEAWQSAQQELFDAACEAALSPDSDVVVLDEILGAIHEKAISESELLYLIQHKYRGTELVITGRGASKALVDAADYVTEMQEIKHPYHDGVFARRGIEF